MPYALEQGMTYLSRALGQVELLRERYGRAPVDGSQLAVELAETAGRRRQHLIDAVSLAWLRLVTAEDHL
ncbi:MAG: hypothetical protein WEB03_14440 [Nitriliruptor sp.]|uniref:hypothetical protein n=1 Tax=Nitriliruptor sp. TaxID=2448056 RepID=UPI00349FF443